MARGEGSRRDERLPPVSEACACIPHMLPGVPLVACTLLHGTPPHPPGNLACMCMLCRRDGHACTLQVARPPWHAQCNVRSSRLS